TLLWTAAATTPNNLLMKRHTNILRASCEMLTCRSSGVKPTNCWFLIGLTSQKTVLRQRQRTNLLTHLSPSTKLFFHDHWTAPKEKIRELFVRTFATKYLN